MKIGGKIGKSLLLGFAEEDSETLLMCFEDPYRCNEVCALQQNVIYPLGFRHTKRKRYFLYDKVPLKKYVTKISFGTICDVGEGL